MARTTLDIDTPILADLKQLGKKQGKSLGRVVSELLAEALAERREGQARPPRLRWIARPMGPARIDLEDREAIQTMLDREELEGSST